MYAAKKLFDQDLKFEELSYKQVKNSDFKEIELKIDGEVKLKFAFAYGFRNIQSIVQKIKKNNCNYHYVEIMACPSGCLNGGGQLREESSNLLSKEILTKVKDVYSSVNNTIEDDKEMVQVYQSLYSDKWLNNNSENIEKYLKTSYHEIKKDNDNLNINW
jgi:iron only hydrogenase large subunit-like protein